ncbi:NAD-glutamate dehydrogenase [Marinobacter orientalis]|uniref:NAD-glutamate dehydrogenase n=1 Tax=Marinobacter orientalis TaxID=1928859 RepID=A0A7Y0WT25_9GAMM|nr:NAD-glutamate dehydrogenase [Marinobacter orientalis]NMT64464.1 NAD-glutamate dehydrogenase [Marinobacter orientalis]TGX50576.1 NAD-glutamate dehydrogenase [Marinobacter orientalis]
MSQPDSRQKQTLLEQLSETLEGEDYDPDDSRNLREIVATMMAESRSWDDALTQRLVEVLGEGPGKDFAGMFSGGFPASYRSKFSVADAVEDIQQIQSIALTSDVPMRFYQPAEQGAQELSFKLYSQGKSVILSDVIPILENLGMRVLGEHPYRIQRRDGERFGISDFTVQFHSRCRGADVEKAKPLLQEGFREIWNGFAENDDFNQLMMAASLGWREVSVLRAYSRYIKQLRFGFSQPFIADTLARHLEITSLLFALFNARFNPDATIAELRDSEAERVESGILEALDAVKSLDDDRILRRFYVLIKATLRTNYFQHQDTGEFKGYLSLKLDPSCIPDIPKPCPHFEVFVCSPRVEGVHLRAGPVARGGLRWSDRSEDYRTEVLGLVKAQQVKNSVIVPVGAKGGFVIKHPPEDGSREALREEGIACYQTFIRGLLDLTDNLNEGVVVPPAEVVRHDGDDTYLVVAADKGTATFSDIANRLAHEYGFWLGDAFASGGSEGYDHKKMGITARGAWESVKRHFLEKGIDTQTDEFTVVGIGDMAGDVFGNGMLLSDRIRLIGAFNHLHIFVDPEPDAASSFAERKRLFGLPGSSWADYDEQLISAGGGVFSRAAKWIPVSPQMQACLGIKAERLPPNELIRALLTAPVDMLWNGGIGTYVKAACESHEDVGDKSNDAVRVDSHQLRCRVLGEGGNLGFTQLARIAFARTGGAANTDFIDNAGGVDCSDHEVNIKILLNEQVRRGQMTLAERNQMLRAMTREVAELVLRNNYRQAMALSLAESGLVAAMDEYERLMKRLEAEGRLDRALEFLPDDEELMERRERSSGLTRPELSVLISYAKIELKQALLTTPIVHDDRFAQALYSAFPASLLEHFPEAIDTHPLRAEISATQIANDMVNRMGISWTDKLRDATGADYGRIAAAYLISLQIHDVETRWRATEGLDGKISPDIQAELFSDVIRLVTRSTSWLLHNCRGGLDPRSCVAHYQRPLAEVLASTETLESVIPASRWKERYDRYCKQTVPEGLAAYAASAESRYWLMDIIEIGRQLERDLEAVAWVYFSLGEGLKLTWLDQQMLAFRARGHWQVLATLHYRDELDHQLRNLTSSVFSVAPAKNGDRVSPEQLLEIWRDEKQAPLTRWHRMLDDMQAANDVDCAVFSVAHSMLRELAAKAE